MISLMLFGLAIPLAVLGAIALRLTVAVYTGIRPEIAAMPTRRPRGEPEVAATLTRPTPATGGTDITATSPIGTEQRITGAPPADVPADEEAEPGPMTIPAFKMAFATLAIVLFGTAFLTGAVRLVVLALMAILQGKGMVGPGDHGQVATVAEAMLLPVAFFLLALLLRDLLPTTFNNACVLAALSLVAFCLVVLLWYAVLWVVLTLGGWLFTWLKPTPVPTAALLLAVPLLVRAFFRLDLAGRSGQNRCR